jgi:CBS domain containing-hemolysin-like protein
VGDIQDELDAEEPQMHVREDGTIVVGGNLPVGDLPLDGFSIHPDHVGETIGAVVLTELGRLAHPGDRIRFGDYEATVEDVRRRRINRVLLQKRPATVAPPRTVDPDTEQP